MTSYFGASSTFRPSFGVLDTIAWTYLYRNLSLLGLLGLGGLLGDGLLKISLLAEADELLLLLLKQLLLLGGHVGEEGLLGASGNVAVEGSDNAVCIVDSDGAHVGESLDLGSAELDLGIGHLEAKLLDTGLDGVPAGQTGGEVDVASHAELDWNVRLLLHYRLI